LSSALPDGLGARRVETMASRFPVWSGIALVLAAVPVVAQAQRPTSPRGVPPAPAAAMPGPVSQGPAAVTVEHTPPGCVLAEQFIRFEATAKPADKIQQGRVYFHAEGEPNWYYVEMQRSGASFSATLPKPEKTTKGVRYYVEIVDAEYHAGRTPENAPIVVATTAACGGKPVAKTVPTATIELFLPPAAPPIPPGFLGDGIKP
jgi:hypothetical protein